MGWAECSSKDAAKIISSSADMPIGRTSVTNGFPTVTVPVLSMTTVFKLPASSSASMFLNTTPSRAALAQANIAAAGSARPIEQGQQTVSTAISTLTASETVPNAAQSAKAIAPAARMTEQNITSARLVMPTTVFLESDICDTERIIRASEVSSPTLCTRTVAKPMVLSVPANTLSETDLSTGIFSPVNMASTTLALPASITPSQGKLSPGFTSTRSPGVISEISVCLSASSIMMVADSGKSSISFFIGLSALAVDFSSKYIPKRAIAITSAQAAKYIPER